MKVVLTPAVLASAAILRAADNNPCITAAGLQDELERGDIDGWMPVVRRWNLTFSQWSAAMELAIGKLTIKEQAFDRWVEQQEALYAEGLRDLYAV